MCAIIGGAGPYGRLLRYLHGRTFVYILRMDANRAEDALDLRERFGVESGNPCSVFEMMVALAVRCEEHIMTNAEIGDRTPMWFWGMIGNLGLSGMTDDCFHEERAADIIDRFLAREYHYDGKGGLFSLSNPRKDMREVEIWYQMMWYLEEQIRGGEIYV